MMVDDCTMSNVEKKVLWFGERRSFLHLPAGSNMMLINLVGFDRRKIN